MTIRVDGIEAEDLSTQVKTVHKLMPASVDAATLDTARAQCIYGGKRIANTKQVVSCG
jgi:hypothetical protein